MTLMYTAINIPYCSLGAALTSDPRENLSLQSRRFAITPIGGALGTALILPLGGLSLPGDRATGIRVAMALFWCNRLRDVYHLFCYHQRACPADQRGKSEHRPTLKTLFVTISGAFSRSTTL